MTVIARAILDSSGLNAASESAIAADGVLLDPIIEVAGAELVLPLRLDPTFVLMLVVVAGVAVGISGAVDADIVLLGPITRVAVADAVVPAGSDTVKAKVELVPKLSSDGMNFSPVSCATVNVSPTLTGVMPSASSTVPSEGSPVTVTTNADEAKLVSVGTAMAIAVAKLFSATVNDVELSVRLDMAHLQPAWLWELIANRRSEILAAAACEE